MNISISVSFSCNAYASSSPKRKSESEENGRRTNLLWNKRTSTVLEPSASVCVALTMSQRHLGGGEQIKQQVELWASCSSFTLLGILFEERFSQANII